MHDAKTDEEKKLTALGIAFINTNGDFIINDVTLLDNSRENLSEVLKNIAGDNDDPHVIISADADTEYQNIVTAMDTAQQLGYTRLTLATRQKMTEK